MTASGAGVFRSLSIFNYRLWAAGALVSNVGTWMQRTAQDWLVLTELTHHSATAVGIGDGAAVRAAALAPALDRLRPPTTSTGASSCWPRRRRWGRSRAALGLLTVAGLVQLWHVYVFAFLFGCGGGVRRPGAPDLRRRIWSAMRTCRTRSR